MDPVSGAEATSLEGLSILLITTDGDRRAELGQALRQRGVGVLDSHDDTTSEGRSLAGVDLLVVDARSADRTAAEVRVIRTDLRTRWASVLMLDFEELVNEYGDVDLEPLSRAIPPAVGTDRALTTRAAGDEPSFETDLAPVGPSRLLRALGASGRTLHVELEYRDLTAEVDLSDDLIVCAFAYHGQERFEGTRALAQVLRLPDARVRVSHRPHPTSVNVMEPVDQALQMAASGGGLSPDEDATTATFSVLPDNDQAAAGTAFGTSESQKPPPPLDDLDSSPPAADPLGDDAVQEPDELSGLELLDDAEPPPKPPSPPQKLVVERPRVPPIVASGASAPGRFKQTMVGLSAMPTQSPRPASLPAGIASSAPRGSSAPPSGAPGSAAPTPRPGQAGADAGRGSSRPRADTDPALDLETATTDRPPPEARADAPTGRPSAGPAPARSSAPPGAGQRAAPAGGGALALQKTLLGVANPMTVPRPKGGLPSLGPSLKAQPQPERSGESEVPTDPPGGRGSGPPTPADASPAPASSTAPASGAPAGAPDPLDDVLPPLAEAEPLPPRGPAEGDDLEALLPPAVEAPDSQPPAPTGAQPEAPVSVRDELGQALPARGPGARGWVLAAAALAALGGAGWWVSQLGDGPKAEVTPDAPAAGAAAALRPADQPTAAADPPAAPASPPAAPEPARGAGTDPGHAAAATEPEAEAEPAAPEPSPPAAPTEPEASVGDGSEAEDRAEPEPAPDESSRSDDGERDKRGSRRLSDEGRDLERAGDLEGAYQRYADALGKDFLNPYAHAGMARIHMEAGRHDEAVESARWAAKLRARRARFRVLLGDALDAAGKRREAERAYLDALDRDPENRAAKAKLGR